MLLAPNCSIQKKISRLIHTMLRYVYSLRKTCVSSAAQMVPSTDSELVCAMDNKKNNNYSNCRDDDALASTWKSQQQIVRPSRISNNNNNNRTGEQQQQRQQSRFVCTTNSWLIFVHLSKFLPYIILNSARHWSKKGAKGQGPGTVTASATGAKLEVETKSSTRIRSRCGYQLEHYALPVLHSGS